MIVYQEQGPERVCTRCRTCELMCAFHHYQVGNPGRARIKLVSLEKGVDIPVTCLNCGQPMCMDACPTDALERPLGQEMVEVRGERCIGCGLCIQACPLGAIRLDPATDKAIKCDLCGGEPQCARYCPTQVLRLADAESLVLERGKHFARLLGRHALESRGAPQEPPS